MQHLAEEQELRFQQPHPDRIFPTFKSPSPSHMQLQQLPDRGSPPGSSNSGTSQTLPLLTVCQRGGSLQNGLSVDAIPKLPSAGLALQQAHFESESSTKADMLQEMSAHFYVPSRPNTASVVVAAPARSRRGGGPRGGGSRANKTQENIYKRTYTGVSRSSRRKLLEDGGSRSADAASETDVAEACSSAPSAETSQPEQLASGLGGGGASHPSARSQVSDHASSSGSITPASGNGAGAHWDGGGGVAEVGPEEEQQDSAHVFPEGTLFPTLRPGGEAALSCSELSKLPVGGMDAASATTVSSTSGWAATGTRRDEPAGSPVASASVERWRLRPARKREGLRLRPLGANEEWTLSPDGKLYAYLLQVSAVLFRQGGRGIADHRLKEEGA